MSGASLQRRAMGLKFQNFVQNEMINLPTITALKYSLPTLLMSSTVNTPKIA